MRDLLHTKAMYLCFVYDPDNQKGTTRVCVVEAHSEDQAKLTVAYSASEKGDVIVVYKLPHEAPTPVEICGLEMLGILA